jgi:hypothetical protein
MNASNLKVKITGQQPLEASPPLFSNFLAISRVAGEVQCEFIFADINQLANIIRADKPSAETVEITGKTVAKIIIPASNFLQLKDHLAQMFADIEKDFNLEKQGERDVRSRASS